MKSIKYTFSIAVAALAMTSCNDIIDVNTTTQFSDSAIWSSSETADGYVMASYQMFNDQANVFNVSGNRFYDAYTDLIKSTSYDMYDHLYNKTWTETSRFGKNNGASFGIWAEAYGRIKRANLLLNQMDEYAGGFGEEWNKIRRAEVRFCRAINYFFIARVYGGVVLRTDTSGKTGGIDDGKYVEDRNRARLSEEDTWAWIIKEMQEAIEDLPEKWADDYYGRATKGMVYGFLSRVALYAHEWEIAADAADKCKEHGNYGLVDDYAQLFDCANDVANRKEIIYAIYGLKDMKTHQYDLNVRPVGDSEYYKKDIQARYVPTAELADMYEFKDGTEFSWSTYTSKHSDPYTDREPRFHATILYNGAPWDTGVQGKDRKIETFHHLTDESIKGKDYFVDYKLSDSTNGHTCTGYYLRKFLSEGSDEFITKNSWNTDIILRYAEVLLNKAEALAELDDIDGALDALNEVRERVDLPGKTKTDAPDYESFMKLLRKERCTELAGEGLRLWDLWRWRLCTEVIDGQSVHGVKIYLRASGKYRYENDVDADAGQKRIFQNRYYRLSLPASELTNNNLAVDNPGW